MAYERCLKQEIDRGVWGSAQWVCHIYTARPVLKLKLETSQIISPSSMPLVVNILLGQEEGVRVMVSHQCKGRP